MGALKPGDWTQGEELLAGLVEIEHDFRNLFVLANRDPKKPSPRLDTLRVPRPSDRAEQTKPRPASAEELAAFLKGSRGLVSYTPKSIGEGD